MELRWEQALELPALKLVAVAALALALSAPAAAATAPTSPVYDEEGNLVETPFVPAREEPRLSEARATAIGLAVPKVRDWVDRYPVDSVTKDATYDDERRLWTVKAWSSLPDAGQIVLARVEDATGRATEAWTGPQVAWKMARGHEGSFGRRINDAPIWLAFCAVFLVGLADFRRLRSLRNLDLLVLLSFSVSLWFFNEGEIFTSVPLAYPPLVYLLGRTAWIGVRGRASPASPPVWPVWVLAVATVFLAGFRVGLNVEASNVIDVGYASVIGAQRIAAQGEMPYDHMPTDEGEECGKADADGYVRERVQTNGRCESANERGDTYGPATYLAYVPGYLAFGWTGKWDDLPAAHFTSIAVDLLVLLGLALVGRRYGGARLAATLPFAWAAYPFTQYVSSSNSNDAIVPLLLVWGFWLLGSPAGRGLFVGLAGLAKFSALPLVPLWAAAAGLRRESRRSLGAYALGLALAAALSLWLVFLEPDPLHALRVVWDRTFGWQLSRPSPFSIWNWGVYPGYPDLGLVQSVLKAAFAGCALLLFFVPRSRSPLQVAGLSAALLIGFELVLTHWFYLYIPWFFPFAALAALAPSVARTPEVEPVRDREIRELVPAG